MQNSSFLKQKIAAKGKKRQVKKVPFVELFHGRLQGVVSSGSDIKRVYVSFFEAGSLNYYCCTNNNRPCAGLNSRSPCKHLRSLLSEGVMQYGEEAIIHFLKIANESNKIESESDILSQIFSQGQKQQQEANTVFSRFLSHLRYLELEAPQQPIPEMSWFVG